jgi:hypothetical protein
MGNAGGILEYTWIAHDPGPRHGSAFSGAGAITAVTVKPGLPLTPAGPAPYILHRGSYEGYS